MRCLSLLLFVIPFAPIRAEEPRNYPPPAQVKAAFLKLLDRPRIPLDPQTIANKPLDDGLIQEHLRFVSEKKAVLPAATEVSTN